MFKQTARILLLVLNFCLILHVTKSEELTENNWQQLLENDEWMIKFFAPWCPACNRLESAWKEFEKKSSQLKIRVGSVDLTKYPSLSGLFSVTSLPTIYHVKDKQYRIYEGNRETDDFVNYVKEKKWTNVKPINAWLTPDSFIMKIVGLLFKVTVYFKELYTLMHEKYDLPNWAVLSIFIFITVLLGLFLGILLIVCIDFICIPRRQEAPKDFKNDEIPSDTIDKNEDNQQNIHTDNDKEKTPENLVKRRPNLRKE